MGLHEAQVAGQLPDIVHHSAEAAGLINAEHRDDHEGAGHNNGLDQVHGCDGAEAAHRSIADNDHRADDHCQQVIPAEQAVEQLADGGQSGGHIGHKENQNDQ